MLQIRKGTAAKNYENSFFREFADNLSSMFDKYALNGLLIGNSECTVDSRLQIDALLVTQKVVCIIDFKNFKGNIYLPNTSDFLFGRWTNSNNELIKGGSSINPYCQLKTQRKRFYDVFKGHIEESLTQSDFFNPGHAVRIVCFQNPIELIGSIPSEDEVNFKIIHQGNYLEKLRDILHVNDKEVNISVNSYPAFLNVFEAEHFDLKERYKEPHDFTPVLKGVDYEGLRGDQKAALKEVDEFLKNEKEQIFILQGTSQSGKSYLIPFVERIAFDSGISQVVILAPSSRIANNLVKDIEGVGSIYAYIYGGNQASDHEEEDLELEEEIPADLEIVPLKKCDNENNAIFIIDESQLISDSYHQSLDLRFGSGYLLKDFVKFSDVKHTSRKIIFIGDCYQLSLGKPNESPLVPSYLHEHYDLIAKGFQLDDIENGPLVLTNALKCAQAVRKNMFNYLQFEFENKFSIVEGRESIKRLVTDKINGATDFKYLCFTNEEAWKINIWVKKSIIGNGEQLALGDLLVINNNINTGEYDNPSARPQKIYNGQFFTVRSVEESTTERVKLSDGRNVELVFRRITVRLVNSDLDVTFLSFENYRNSLKAQLSDDEIIGLKVLLNRELKLILSKSPFEKSSVYGATVESAEYIELSRAIEQLRIQFEQGEKVKTKLDQTERRRQNLLRKAERSYKSQLERELLKDPSSNYYKLKNLALLRFGWALNVHKAMSYKWQSIVFNVDRQGGIANASYFKWVYTGLTRSLGETFLINYKAILPTMNVEFRDNSTNRPSPDEYFLVVDRNKELAATDQNALRWLNLVDNVDRQLAAQLYSAVAVRLSGSAFKIKGVESPHYQQVYSLEKDSREVKIRFYYDGQFRVKMPVIQGDAEENTGIEALALFTKSRPIDDFDFISTGWRIEFYSGLSRHLKKRKLFIQNIVQNPYKDTLFIADVNDLHLQVELNYNADGFFSSMIALFCSTDVVWKEFISIIKSWSDD